MKAFAAAVLIFAAVLSLAACGAGEGAAEDSAAVSVPADSCRVVMSYEGRTLISGMYGFIFSALKTRYLELLQAEGDGGFVGDTEAFWSSVTKGGKTFAEAVTDDINTYCKMLLVCGEMASEYSVCLDSAAFEEVAAKYDGYVASYGGEAELERYLGRYGISRKELSDYLRDDRLISEVQDRLCSAGGICEVSDGEVYERIDADYAKAKQVFLSDEKHGGRAFEEAKELLSQIKSGEKSYADFEGLSEGGAEGSPSGGFLVGAEESDGRRAAVVFALKAGECGVCEAEGGACLVLRTELTDADRRALFDRVWQKMADERFSKLLSDRYDFVESDRDELKKYDIVTADLLL